MIAGGREVEVPAPLDELPLLASPRGTSGARLTLAASLATLERPFTPCGVAWQGAPLPDRQWSYDSGSGVLHAVVSGSGSLVARQACVSGTLAR